MQIMIIATIYNTKTRQYAEQAFSSCEQAEKTISALNANMPSIGFLMIVDYEPAE
jgi:hypothetical protein